MEKIIPPRLKGWLIFHLLAFVLLYVLITSKDYVFAVLLLPIFFWTLFYGRRPRLIFKDSTLVLSLFIFKKELPYSAIKAVSLYSMLLRDVPLMQWQRLYPPLWYGFAIVTGVVLFFILFSKETLADSLKLSGIVFVVALIGAAIIHLLYYWTGKIKYNETCLSIQFDPLSLQGMPFSYYRKRPFFYSIKAWFPDLTKSQYVDIISILQEKLDPRVFHNIGREDKL